LNILTIYVYSHYQSAEIGTDLPSPQCHVIPDEEFISLRMIINSNLNMLQTSIFYFISVSKSVQVKKHPF